MKILLTATFAVLSITSFSQSKKFNALLNEASMTFTMPADFDTIAVAQNPDMNYELAIKSKSDSFEIRYTIRPLAKRIADFEKMIADTSRKQVLSAGANPNTNYKVIFTAILLNTSKQQSGRMALPKSGAFKPDAVKKEFNADWGATSSYAPRSTFANDYKTCMTVALHKDGVANAYIFYLFNNRETLMKILPSVFHSLKFK